MYAIAIANSGLAKQIYLVGFDGFDFEDSRYIETREMIEKYHNIGNALKLISLTPTKYPIKTKSVFFI